MLHALRDALNRCILRAAQSDCEPSWFFAGPPPELNILRVCDEIGTAVFVASLWVGDPVNAITEHIDRVNQIKVHVDLFVEATGEGWGHASDEAVRLWECVSCSKTYVDTHMLMDDFCFLEKILFLSNPLKLRDALIRCNNDLSLQVGVCRLYSDELDTVVGLLSQQRDFVRQQVFMQLV
jgi:hypothetical protein